jgi:hypothetical protein
MHKNFRKKSGKDKHSSLLYQDAWSTVSCSRRELHRKGKINYLPKTSQTPELEMLDKEH